jgi:hypothetical protein
LWLGPIDPRTVLLMQPILMVVTAVAVGGIARRLAGPGAALVSGSVVPVLPTVVLASQTYWYGLGAACFAALGIWALLASERLTNRWAYAYGAGIGAMLLCRTMTLGYLPAMLAAGVVVAGRERRSWIGLAKATSTLLVVALPWWFVARHAIFDYLFSYGYGKRAGLFGAGGPWVRLFRRLHALRFATGDNWRWAAVVVAAAAAATAWRWHRDGPTTPTWTPVARSAAAVAAASALSVAALTSTTNNGVWFETPIVVLLVPLAVAAGSRAPTLVKAAALVPVAGLAVLQLGCSLWLIAPGPTELPGIAREHRVTQYEFGFVQYDLRMGPQRRRELPEAAREWWALNRSVERELRRIARPGREVVITFSGSFELLNSNSVMLAAELRGWTPRIVVPDTVGSAAHRATLLTPDARDGSDRASVSDASKPVERVLVIARHHLKLFTPDANVRDLDREAVAAGWKVVWRAPIPVGGEVVVMRHPGGP